MEPETNHKLHDETGATERTPTPYAMEEAKRQRNLGCLISFLFVFGLVCAVLLDACRHERYKAWYAHRYEPLNREVLEPLKKKYCIVPRGLDRFLDLIGVNVLDCRRAGAEQNPTDHIAPEMVC